MTDSPSCPTRRMIRELLADPSSAADSAHLVKHLEGCKECREEIDASVGQLSAMLTTLRAGLADETSKNPSLRQAIEDLLARNPLAAALTDRMERLIDLRISGGVELPTRLGPYEIIKRIGKGGMGVVYLGHDPKLDRDVAIKLMAP
ncbi:MAG: hypothetical protein GXP27_10715, partial [Planctomycetes bacterium]|nr:hypothetical protein [Planctomycetota bacterium]